MTRASSSSAPSSTAETPRHLVGSDPSIDALREQIATAAPTREAVLILGETGSGKDIVAELLLRASPRAEKPWRAVNCSELRPELAANELFGHEAGAFTGAGKRRDGLFRAVDTGTLFLDEIADLPLEVQTQLLRAIEQGEIRRQGADSYDKVDVRVIAATNADLDDRVLRGRFRHDLFERFVWVIRMSPLRERPTDIEALVRHFIDLHRQTEGMTGAGVVNEFETATGRN